jgi:pimeloyl-ACP methyl ester carboxylesterase
MKQFSSYAYVLLMFFVSFTHEEALTQNPAPFDVTISGHGAKTIIFIPGFACSGDVWKETKVPFEKDFTCHTLTMAGFAGSKPMTNPTFKAWETGIVEYIKTNKIEKPIVVGHSMGGGLAMAIAADYPDLLEKIVVVDALPCLGALMNPTFKVKEKNNCAGIVSKMTGMTAEQFKEMQNTTMPQLLADTSKLDMVVGWSVKSDRKTFAEMYCDFSNTDLREKMSTVKCPTLVLLEAYFINLKPTIDAQFKGLKTANLQYATKGLHFIMYDDKEWYDKQLTDFLKAK